MPDLLLTTIHHKQSRIVAPRSRSVSNQLSRQFKLPRRQQIRIRLVHEWPHTTKTGIIPGYLPVSFLDEKQKLGCQILSRPDFQPTTFPK
jgi:hypothetical protein